MRGRLTYLSGHEGSEKQASIAAESLSSNGWEVEAKPGFTRWSVYPKQMPIMLDSRLDKISQETYKNSEARDKRLDTKRACVMNHVEFWKEVVFMGHPMAFFEHDAVAIGPPQDWEFEDVLILNAEYAFDFGALKGKFSNWKIPKTTEVRDLPHDYPLWCKVEGSPYFGAKMICGTAAYAVTPKGANELLNAVHSKGLEQSDYIINEMNVRLQYITPSPIKFADKNLGTSNG